LFLVLFLAVALFLAAASEEHRLLDSVRNKIKGITSRRDGAGLYILTLIAESLTLRSRDLVQPGVTPGLHFCLPTFPTNPGLLGGA
jgi:hypothetical protein